MPSFRVYSPPHILLTASCLNTCLQRKQTGFRGEKQASTSILKNHWPGSFLKLIPPQAGRSFTLNSFNHVIYFCYFNLLLNFSLFLKSNICTNKIQKAQKVNLSPTCPRSFSSRLVCSLSSEIINIWESVWIYRHTYMCPSLFFKTTSAIQTCSLLCVLLFSQTLSYLGDCFMSAHAALPHAFSWALWWDGSEICSQNLR